MDLEKNKIKTAFVAPESYFQDLEARILSEINISPISKLKLEAPSVYFDELESNILAKAKLDELLAIQKLPIPENYFENFENRILALSKMDGLLHKEATSGYFEKLEQNILAEARIDAMQGIDELPVPKAYFDTLSENVISKTASKPKFSIFKNVTLFRSAAAVAMIALAALGYSVLKPEAAPQDQLAEISSEAMVAYLTEQPIMAEDLQFVIGDNEGILPTEVSDSDVSAYLVENGI